MDWLSAVIGAGIVFACVVATWVTWQKKTTRTEEAVSNTGFFLLAVMLSVFAFWAGYLK